MDPVYVLYAKCDIAKTFSILQETSEKYHYWLWSLRGDPTLLQFSDKTVALRASIHNEKVSPNGEFTSDYCLGTVHIALVADERTRVTFQRDDLAGTSLENQLHLQFAEFCDYFDLLLDANGEKLSDDETGGRTKYFEPLVDTGPILT
jgi:hypothetical protein